MMLYAAIAAALFAVSAVATFILGSQLPAMAVFPIPVAVYVVRRKPWHAIGLVLVSGAAASIGMIGGWFLMRFVEPGDTAAAGRELVLITVWPGLYQMIFCSAGLLMGWGIVRRWTYARVVYAVSLTVFGLTLAHDLLFWQEWTSQTQTFLGVLEESISEQAAQQNVELPEAQRQAIEALKANWWYIVFGLNYLAILGVTCLAVTLTAAGLRRWLGDPGPIGSFMTMRPSEWLVWLAILVAAVWLLDFYRPMEPVRFVAWNAAVGLAAVYWFNGLSILIYGTHVLRPPVLLLLAVLIAVVLMDIRVLLMTFGLFDTWANFRAKCDAYAQAKKAREEDDF